MKFKITILIALSLLLISMVYGAEELVESDSHSYARNEFLDDSDNAISLIIPALLLVVTIIMFAVDFGTVGVSLASMLSLVTLYFLQIVYMNPVSLISFIIIVGIMIYKIGN